MSKISKDYNKGVSKMVEWLKNPVKIKFLNSRIKLILFIVVFAGVGGWLIWHSLASTTLVGSIQTEQMSLPSGASIVNDSYASGGQAMMLTTPGETAGQITLPTSSSSYSIVVKGTSCKGGRWWRRSSSTQNVVLSIDGNQLLSKAVTSTSWTTFSGSTSLAPTSHQLSIKYTASSSYGCTQSLYLDVVNFYGEAATIAPAPTVNLGANPADLLAGSSATLSWNSTNASSCIASGSWSGSKPISGSASTGALNNTSSYTLSCTGNGGTASKSVNIAVTVASPPSIVPTTMGRFGYSVHINRMSDKAAYIDYAKNSNAKTVRDDFMWSGIESTKGSYNWSAPDNLMTLTAQRNIDLLPMVGYTPQWAWVSGCTTSDKCEPANITDYVNFVTQVAKRYGANGTFWAANPSLNYRPIQAIEIWNEPNIHFWLPKPNPIKYTAMLKASYSAIKAVDSNIKVISGGLAPYGAYGQTNGSTFVNPLTYLEKMYQNGALGSMDAIGWHPYNWSAGNTSSAMFGYHAASAWSQMDETSKREPAPNNVSVRSLMTQYGDSAKKIWATEVGAPTVDGKIPESEQAIFATNSVAYWKSYSWAGNYYWYDLRDDCSTGTDPECRYGAIHQNNTFKAAYNALKTAFGQ